MMAELTPLPKMKAEWIGPTPAFRIDIDESAEGDEHFSLEVFDADAATQAVAAAKELKG